MTRHNMTCGEKRFRAAAAHTGTDRAKTFLSVKFSTSSLE